MTITVTGDATYTVVKELRENAKFRFYLAFSDARPGTELMLKIATGVEYNGLLDREAMLLTNMREEAARRETEYARVRPGAGTLNYQIGFPEMVETFTTPEQGNRRVLILGFDAAQKDLAELAPIALVRIRDKARVDPRTSAWVMGKLLKIIAFAHDQSIAVGDLTGENILIVRKHHLVSVCSWSEAELHPGKLENEVVRGEIRAATRSVVLLLGGDPETGHIPEDEQLVDGRYQAFLTSMLRGAYSSANKAHSAFYELVEALWERKFHPYTTYPL